MRPIAWLRCYVRGCHEPQRHPLGGFTCATCKVAGASLDEMGFEACGYVSPVRKTYSREDGGVTRTSQWERGERGW